MFTRQQACIVDSKLIQQTADMLSRQEARIVHSKLIQQTADMFSNQQMLSKHVQQTVDILSKLKSIWEIFFDFVIFILVLVDFVQRTLYVNEEYLKMFILQAYPVLKQN